MRALLCKAGANDYRDGVLRHEFFEERQAIHARHLDIEGDHVGDLLADSLSGDKGIARGGDDLDLGIGREQVAESLATRRRRIPDRPRVLGLSAEIGGTRGGKESVPL